MIKYIKYFFYIIEHKFNVGIECFNMGLYWHAFTHDLSKFLPDEFFPYANWFYSEYGLNWKKNSKQNSKQSITHHLDNNSFFLSKLVKRNWIRILKLNSKLESDFNKAWEKHKKRNKHHPGCPSHLMLSFGQKEDILSHNGGICEGVRNILNSDKAIFDMSEKYIKQMVCDLKGMSRKFGGTAKEYYDKNKNDFKLSKQSRKKLEELLQ